MALSIIAQRAAEGDAGSFRATSFVINLATRPSMFGFRHCMALVAGLAAGCAPPIETTVAAPVAFQIDPDANMLLTPASDDPWAGTWSIESGALDGQFRITRLEAQNYAVEWVSHWTSLMTATVTNGQLVARQNNSILMRFDSPRTGETCIRVVSSQLPDSPTSLLACRAN